MSLIDVERLRESAEVEFADIRHFHNGSETNISESYLSAIPEEALREFLTFVRAMLGAAARGSQ